jgi:glycosyltransferase involved in cell wall biosynthesis
VPFCDQGLGLQGLNYYKLLKSVGYNVHIFSLKPYNANSALELQKDPNEWIVESIYYSPNDREHVKDIEVLEFIKTKNIGKCIIPEICWYRIFEIAKLLKNNDVNVYAIPNIEITKKNEMTMHKHFYKILCNNMLCKNVFDGCGINNNEYIGYGIFGGNNYKEKNFSLPLKLLFIGGQNAFSRKNILNVCTAFVNAYDVNKNIMLTCTIQKTNLLEVDDVNKLNAFIGHPGITFIQEHLTYKKIIELYHSHHICLQVSRTEGLGLGFYESVSTGTPVISLNAPPHNEIILDGVNGYLIECYEGPMFDNVESFIKGLYFKHELLTKKILEVVNNINGLKKIFKTLIVDYNKRLSIDVFKLKFINSLQ